MEVAAIDIDSLMMKTPAAIIPQRRTKRTHRNRKQLFSSLVMHREPASPAPLKRRSPFAEEPETNTQSVKRSCMSPLRGSALTHTRVTTTTTSTGC